MNGSGALAAHEEAELIRRMQPTRYHNVQMAQLKNIQLSIAYLFDGLAGIMENQAQILINTVNIISADQAEHIADMTRTTSEFAESMRAMSESIQRQIEEGYVDGEE